MGQPSNKRYKETLNVNFSDSSRRQLEKSSSNRSISQNKKNSCNKKSKTNKNS